MTSFVFTVGYLLLLLVSVLVSHVASGFRTAVVVATAMLGYACHPSSTQ